MLVARPGELLLLERDGLRVARASLADEPAIDGVWFSPDGREAWLASRAEKRILRLSLPAAR